VGVAIFIAATAGIEAVIAVDAAVGAVAAGGVAADVRAKAAEIFRRQNTLHHKGATAKIAAVTNSAGNAAATIGAGHAVISAVTARKADGMASKVLPDRLLQRKKNLCCPANRLQSSAIGPRLPRR